MRTYKIILIVIIGLMLVAVVAVAALIFVDPSVYRNQIERRASATFGREFKIAGPIHLQRSLRPRIILEDISIGNPEWATRPRLATAEKVGLQVALLPLLRGELRILDTAFSGVNLYIEEGPGGVNNYTFGEGNRGERRGLLPQIERLQVKDGVINFRSAGDSDRRFEIKEARLWNIPGEPERIEARGITREMTFTILLVADGAAELSGPNNPWSLKLDIQGPDMSLILTGQMEQAFKWQQGDYHFKLSGDQADSLESLFDMDLPTYGPFELSANVNKTERSFRITEIAARIQGPPEAPVIDVTGGDASGGDDDPLQLALQGQLDDMPFAFNLASNRPLGSASQTTPWPVEARLDLPDLTASVEGEIIPATAVEHLEFDAKVQGGTLAPLEQLLGVNLPNIGPYQLSFRSQISEGNYIFSALQGSIEGAGPWQAIHLNQGKASINNNRTVAAALDGKFDEVPMTLTFEGGPLESKETDETTWPLKLEASAFGATINGNGTIVTTEQGRMLKLVTRVSGNRLESLGPLIGASLPAIGKFNLSAEIKSDGTVHEAGKLNIQAGSNRITGRARWEDRKPRPLLTARLSSNRLKFGEFGTRSTSSSKRGKENLMDRPIDLDSLTAFDARVEFAVNRVADSPVPLTDVQATAALENGVLKTPFRVKLVGTPVKGQIHLRRRNNVPLVSVDATAGKVDVGQLLEKLKIPKMVTGTADAVELNASSAGKTLNAMLAQPVGNVNIKPANLRYRFDIGDKVIDFKIEGAEVAIDKDQPLSSNIGGLLRGAPFTAEFSSANLKQLRLKGTPLPLQVSLQSKDVRFKARGSIVRPFEKNEFEIDYEMSGPQIEGLDPLADFALPLRGEFQTSGRVTRQGKRFTYQEDLRVGKSNLKADVTVLQKQPRPEIKGSLKSTQIHMDDVQLFDVDGKAETDSDISRVIPDYQLPVDAFLAVDVDLDLRAERVRARLGDLGEIVSKISLQDGRFTSAHSVKGLTGARVNGELDLNATVDPPLTRFQIKAKDLNFGFLLSNLDVTDTVEGKIDLQVDLVGSGATRYEFLGNAEGSITFIGGPGRISGRRIDLWAADLIPTMLSSQWQREDVTETNCLVTHIKVGEGQATIEDLMLDTQRVTIAASGLLNLENEELDIIMAPRPKRASLVSLANPVRIQGTLAEPEVSVTRIPRGRRLAGTGLLAGLVNPAFLLFALSDSGTRDANPCDAVVESVRESAGIDSK